MLLHRRSNVVAGQQNSSAETRTLKHAISICSELEVLGFRFISSSKNLHAWGSSLWFLYYIVHKEVSCLGHR